MNNKVSYSFFLISNFCIITIGIIIAGAISFISDFNWIDIILIYGGFIYLIAGIGRPYWFFLVVRRTSWFQYIRNDSIIRLVFFTLSIICILLGTRTFYTNFL
ncbi:MAG: hypothetical protein GY793_07065 [Proteobacteria bacterium]|nr:hypothetical protein [Pseudomonadota bacterium]